MGSIPARSELSNPARMATTGERRFESKVTARRRKDMQSLEHDACSGHGGRLCSKGRESLRDYVAFTNSSTASAPFSR